VVRETESDEKVNCSKEEAVIGKMIRKLFAGDI